LSAREYLPFSAEGRIRYCQERLDSRRGTVNAVPESGSAESPKGTLCGEVKPPGGAPVIASDENSLQKPD